MRKLVVSLGVEAMISYVLGFILRQKQGTVGLTCCPASGNGCAHPASPKTTFEFGPDLALSGLEAKLRG